MSQLDDLKKITNDLGTITMGPIPTLNWKDWFLLEEDKTEEQKKKEKLLKEVERGYYVNV